MGYNLGRLEPELREAVAAYESLISCGLVETEIGVTITPNRHALVIAQRYEKSAYIDCGITHLPPQVFVGRWQEAIRAIYDGEIDVSSYKAVLATAGTVTKLDAIEKMLRAKGILTNDDLSGPTLH